MKDNGVNPIIQYFVRNQADIQNDRYSNKGSFDFGWLRNT